MRAARRPALGFTHAGRRRIIFPCEDSERSDLHETKHPGARAGAGARAVSGRLRPQREDRRVRPADGCGRQGGEHHPLPTYDDGKGGYFSVTLPASWGDDYLTECGANDGGYYVGFYEKTDYDNGLGGFLFMLEVFPTDYDYTVLPEYQAICGLTVDGANYNLIAELPTDVQFANENADLYRSMSNDFSVILKSLTFSKGVTRTEVTAPTQTSGSGS